jgi:DNA-binding NarL/FixJ family response regulator
VGGAAGRAAGTCQLVAGTGLLGDIIEAQIAGSGRPAKRAETVGGALSGHEPIELVVVAAGDGADPGPALEYGRTAGISVVVVVEQASPSLAAGLVAAGATSVVTVDSGVDAFVATLQLTSRGASVLDPAVAAAVLADWRRLRAAADHAAGARAELTSREVEILTALAEGLPTKAIARRLEVSVRTVENHKANVFKKLGVRNQAQAVALALNTGLLERHPPA